MTLCPRDVERLPRQEVQCIQRELRNDVWAILQKLSERHQLVLALRFGLHDGVNRTLDEVAQLIGVTREQIRQNQEKALRLIRRNPLNTQRLEPYRGAEWEFR